MAKKKLQEDDKKERRANGEGSWFDTENGKGFALTYKDPVTREKKRKYFYGKNTKDVQAKTKAFIKGIEEGNSPAVATVTVEQWLDTWMETYKKPSVRQNTYEGYQYIIKSHLTPTIGPVLLKDLRVDQVQNMLNKKMVSGNRRTKGPLGARQIEYIYSVLHMALEQAYKNQMIPRNVCDAVNKPKKEKHEFIPWTMEETNSFLASVKNSRLFPLYVVAWGSGLRRSELLGLQWPDIDFQKRSLTVRRTLVRVKGGYKFGEPKTKKSRRTIPLPEQVMEALKKWKSKQAREKMKWNARYKDIELDKRPAFNPLNMVFNDEMGEPVNPEFISRCFKKDSEDAKLPNIRFHDLRHGHATMLLELGEDIKVISDRLGHSTITLTADTYSHVGERLQREASNKLEKVFSVK